MTTGIQIKRAQRSAVWLKLCVCGVSGSGKTLGSLKLAKGITGEPVNESGKVCIIDTENKSGSLYQGTYGEFLTIEINRPFEPEKFIEALKVAEQAGVKCAIIDSASHIWEGILEYKENLDAKSGGRSGFNNWRQAGDKFRDSLKAVLECNMHVIACLRSKTEYVQETVNGRTQIRKIGLQPVFRDGAEFEFTTIFQVNDDNMAYASKDRTFLFPHDRVIKPHLSEDIGKELRDWSQSGAAQAPVTPQPAAQSNAEPPYIRTLKDVAGQAGIDAPSVLRTLKVENWGQISQPMAEDAIKRIEAKLAAKASA